MKAKTPLPPLNIVQAEEPGYASIESLIGENNNSVINQSNKTTENLYSVIRIVRSEHDHDYEPITPVTPATPNTLMYATTPVSKVPGKIYIRYPQHNKDKPIGPTKCNYEAPEEAPPPIPSIYCEDTTIVCASGVIANVDPYIGG